MNYFIAISFQGLKGEQGDLGTRGEAGDMVRNWNTFFPTVGNTLFFPRASLYRTEGLSEKKYREMSLSLRQRQRQL